MASANSELPTIQSKKVKGAKAMSPGTPTVESKSEEFRKRLEEIGILQVFEHAVNAILKNENCRGEELLIMFSQDLIEHSYEKRQLEAVENEIALLRHELDAKKYEKAEREENELEFENLNLKSN